MPRRTCDGAKDVAQDVAKDVAVDVWGAEKDGGLPVFFVAPKTPSAKSCTKSYATSFTCSSFTCRPRAVAKTVSKTAPGPAASTTGSKTALHDGEEAVRVGSRRVRSGPTLRVLGLQIAYLEVK